MSDKITGHMVIWTLNKKMCAFSIYGFDYEKLYVYVSINHWTQGLLDTQQNNVSLFSIPKVICVCLFKYLDTWTFGHTTKQSLFVQYMETCVCLHTA